MSFPPRSSWGLVDGFGSSAGESTTDRPAASEDVADLLSVAEKGGLQGKTSRQMVFEKGTVAGNLETMLREWVSALKTWQTEQVFHADTGRNDPHSGRNGDNGGNHVGGVLFSTLKGAFYPDPFSIVSQFLADLAARHLVVGEEDVLLQKGESGAAEDLAGGEGTDHAAAAAVAGRGGAPEAAETIVPQSPRLSSSHDLEAFGNSTDEETAIQQQSLRDSKIQETIVEFFDVLQKSPAPGSFQTSTAPLDLLSASHLALLRAATLSVATLQIRAARNLLVKTKLRHFRKLHSARDLENAYGVMESVRKLRDEINLHLDEEETVFAKTFLQNKKEIEKRIKFLETEYLCEVGETAGRTSRQNAEAAGLDLAKHERIVGRNLVEHYVLVDPML